MAVKALFMGSNNSGTSSPTPARQYLEAYMQRHPAHRDDQLARFYLDERESIQQLIHPKWGLTVPATLFLRPFVL